MAKTFTTPEPAAPKGPMHIRVLQDICIGIRKYEPSQAVITVPQEFQLAVARWANPKLRDGARVEIVGDYDHVNACNPLGPMLDGTAIAKLEAAAGEDPCVPGITTEA